MKENSAQSCADLLCTQFFPRFGCPLVIHSDGGCSFQADLFKAMCKILDIGKTKTARFRPQSDGVVERCNRSLKKMLKSVVTENPKGWAQFLPYLQQAYNSSVHETTKCTPNLLMFGCENRIPLDIIFADGLLDHAVPECPNAYAEWVRDASRIAFEKAREHLKSSIERQKTYYDKNCSQIRQFHVGQWVWIYHPPEIESNKLAKRWGGPYLVIQKLPGGVNYIVQRERTSRKLTLHVDHMKEYNHDTPPSWLAPKHKESTTQTD